MTDLESRLRRVAEDGCDPDLPHEAADEIFRLRQLCVNAHDALLRSGAFGEDQEILAMLASAWSGEPPTPAFAAGLVAAERDCRTCKNWTPHHRSDVMHCSAALRCVAGSSYQRQGVVQLWEAAPIDAGF